MAKIKDEHLTSFLPLEGLTLKVQHQTSFDVGEEHGIDGGESITSQVQPPQRLHVHHLGHRQLTELVVGKIEPLELCHRWPQHPPRQLAQIVGGQVEVAQLREIAQGVGMNVVDQIAAQREPLQLAEGIVEVRREQWDGVE